VLFPGGNTGWDPAQVNYTLVSQGQRIFLQVQPPFLSPGDVGMSCLL